MNTSLTSQSLQEMDRRIRGYLDSSSTEMEGLFREMLRFRSTSGHEGPFVRFLAGWAIEKRLAQDLWQAREGDLRDIFTPGSKHIPLAGRPTLVITLPGKTGGKSLMLNAHADVVDADESLWTRDPWGGTMESGRFFGRGACDTKGPLLGGLWAMLAVRELIPIGLPGDLMLEVIPGEEDCVGLGTSTSIARGYRADAAVVLEPTGNRPMPASRSGLRFEITCRGKSVHGTVKWLGTDAIALMRRVLEILNRMEERYNKEGKSQPLFSEYPIARPITVDAVSGGRWQGMICDVCSCGGYFELLPGDDLEEWKERFAGDLRREAAPGEVEIAFGEEYQGHLTDTGDAFCRGIREVIETLGNGKPRPQWAGFNSGCEAGIRAGLHGTPTVVWGPGDLAEAHRSDESISFSDIRTFARLLASVIAYRSTR